MTLGPMKTIRRDIVGALIYSVDGKILMGQKDPSKGGVYDGDCWHIPGGGIDEGETKEEALKREISEEVGIDISPYDIQLFDDEGEGESEKVLKSGEVVMCKMKFFVYKIILDKKAEEVAVALQGDLVRHEWVDESDLKKKKLTPPSVELFSRLGLLA